MPNKGEACTCDGSSNPNSSPCPLHSLSITESTFSDFSRRSSLPLAPPSMASRNSSVYCTLSASHFQNDKTLLDETTDCCRSCKRPVSEHSFGDYSCKVCTFVNPIDQPACGICGTPQYADESPRRMGRAAALLNNSLDLASFPLPKRPSRKMQPPPPQLRSRSPSTSPVSNQSPSFSADKWIQADSSGLWMCPRCSQKNLPLTSACEICLKPRTVAQGAEEPIPQKLLVSLAEVMEPRKDWSMAIAQRLLNFEELVVNGSHTFRLTELEFCFSNEPKKSGQWYFQLNQNDEITSLGMYFGMGSIVFIAIQGNEPCRCDKKAAACVVCNSIIEGSAAVARTIMACGITHALVQDLREAELTVNVPNEFLCLRSYTTSLGRELNFSFHVSTNHAAENGASNSNNGNGNNNERIRYCSLGAEMLKRQLIRDMYIKNCSVREIAEKVGKSPQEVSSLLPKTPPVDPAGVDEFKSPRLSSGEAEVSFTRPGSGSISSFGEKLGMAKLCESPMHIQASMLASFFGGLYNTEKPTRWGTEIARNILFAISRVGSKLPQALLFGERDISIHELLPKDQQRKQLWLRLLMPLFTTQDTAVTKDENAVACEECENSVATMRCEHCGVFCKPCIETLHMRGQRKQHAITIFDPPGPGSPLTANKASQIASLAANGQYLAGCVVSWSFIHQNVEEFVALLQEVQVAIEALGWNDANYEKLGGFLMILLKKISQHIRSFKSQMVLEHLDRLLALVNFVEEFCFFSPSFGFSPKPASGQLALHFTDTGSAAKEVMILFEEILGKQLNVTAENPLSCEPEEYKKRQKGLQNALALFKAGVVWCNSLESELCNASPVASTQYCTAVAALLTVIIQRPRFKKNGCDRKQASSVFMGAVAGCAQKQAVPPSPREPLGWEKVNLEMALFQLKCGLSSIGNVISVITKDLELKRVFATGVEKISQQEDKRLDKMARFEETTQFVRGVIYSQAARYRTFVSEVTSEVLTPLAQLQKDHEKEISNLQAAAQQYRVDTDAQKQKLRSLRETALKCYLELVKVYWNTREKSNPEASKKLLSAKASCLQSFVDFERASAELEKRASDGLFAELKAAELKRMTLMKAYLRRLAQAVNRLTSSYPANDELERMLSSLELEADLRQFAQANPSTEEQEDLPLKSVQVLTNKWVEMLPENQPDPPEDGSAAKEGVLFVGARGKSWEQRTVTLREGTLCHYTKASKRPSLGGFSLAGSSVYTWGPDFILLGRKGGMFGVLPAGTGRVTQIFQASDEKEKQSWVDALVQQGGTLRGLADNTEEPAKPVQQTDFSPRMDGSATTTFLPSLDSNSDGTARKQSPTAPPRPKLISRVTFPEHWTSAKGACQINPEDTAYAIVSKMAAKHGGGPPERYALFHEAEALDDNLLLHSRFGAEATVIAFTIKRSTRERKPTAPANDALPPPPVAKFSLPEDWTCRTAATVLSAEDTVATVLAKLVLKYGPAITTPPGEEHVLSQDEEVLADHVLLLPLCEKSPNFAVKPKRVSMKVDESVPPRRTRTRTLSLTAIGGTLSALTARTSTVEEIKLPELTMKVTCPVHWACSIASYNVNSGETAKTVVRKLAKMYAGDSEKYALLYEDDMVDEDTILSNRFKGIVAFSVQPSFGGSWF